MTDALTQKGNLDTDTHKPRNINNFQQTPEARKEVQNRFSQDSKEPAPLTS